MIYGGVHYAVNGEFRLAYRVLGDGEPTLVWIPGWVSNVDMMDDPESMFTGFFEQLAEQTRFVAWDKRGTGLSDPVIDVPPLDERMDDLHAVLDAAGAQRPALFGVSEGGPMSILFAGTFPERVRSLILYGTLPRFARELPDYPWGFSPAQIAEFEDEIRQHWGEGALAEAFFGPIADVPGFRDFYGRVQRCAASPRMALMLWQAVSKIDVRPLLSSIRTPTLVLARRGDLVAPPEAARALADAIPAATYQELPPGPHGLFDDAMASAILDFVCGATHDHNSERVLSTVLFTDIVSSTEMLSAHGDSQWRHELDVHDRVVDRLLSKFGGRRAKHTGDGVFALFDGPTKAARCGLELVPALAGKGMHVRVGVHIGECERRGDEWSGTAIHVGARIGGMAGADEVLASRTVRDLSAGSGLRFESLGPQRLKGFPEATEVFRVTKPRGVAF
ncbi:adenylate/guanylate cyclase domain-containing protein [Mycolicibacterium sp. 120270]|uniref:adenylate/guanylate cyclase domain-containing protein n=1 Tax=Mycolicibacterium sp. 120270 TaxID=3090600 RepID=UPI00299E80ED|nr:adenylate/guanylate cyclase domain-containing protein [Mycolicibacterium sp. 120270]MDX1885924.1 adenylate/guanylate cyclase domain-containing protein [Mycolicibacterium sp. 120270]